MDVETAKQKLKKYNKQLLEFYKQKPRFKLLENGFKARVNCVERALTIYDIQCFILSCFIPSPRLSFVPSFYELLRCLKASKVAIFILDDNISFDGSETQLFDETVVFEADEDWLESLLFVPLSNRQLTKIDDVSSLPNIRMKTDLNFTPVKKTDLLLSTKQMYQEGFLFPDEDNHMKCTRHKYRAVSDDSPLFGLDCEMCINVDGESVVTRIALVNEELETIIDTFINPEKPIKNYLTRYSGVTKEILDKVDTTLSDVKRMLRKSLPRDSIICGQSLNYDMNKLALFHPYVIDTSVIFNESGSRVIKSSLKNLSAMHLNEEIQCNKYGHCSIEDAKACVKLVKLKLSKGLEYGDRVLNPKQYASNRCLPIARFVELQNISVKVFYDFLNIEDENKFICVMDSWNDALKRTLASLLATENCICVVISKGLCRIRVS
ncbi:putative exonuclease-like protein [Dinothrombium tinctorium]|uniref:Putative exonuclease-like protein n=1 Tax=Dinothrombium tinctorium TaxID=1965070 RepID=A0A3S3PIF9_9ACAR|nr:putative exonuclease-like protein [Dinothrombium tinctorium]RWS02580.1 putative exonuclease-like protein [Dinothrombium tinctorium]